MINTLPLQISYPLLPLQFTSEHKQTQVDRLISFYTSCILSGSQLCVQTNARALHFWRAAMSCFSLTGKVDIIDIMWTMDISHANTKPHVRQIYTHTWQTHTVHIRFCNKIVFLQTDCCSLFCLVIAFPLFKHYKAEYIFVHANQLTEQSIGFRERLQPDCKSLQTPTVALNRSTTQPI